MDKNANFACTANCTNDGMLYAGHTARSNYLFSDGHVKALAPLATVDAAEGGSGTINMWTVDNSAFASPGNVTGSGGTLTVAANYYHP